MSLYRYVAGRDDLLEGMVEQMVTQLHLGPDGGRPGPGDGWQAYLQWLAHGVRALAREHPQVFPLIATRHPAAPWLRPPLRSLRVVEDFLSTLVARGFTDDGAVAAYRAFSSFLLGHLLLEAAMLGSRTGPGGRPDRRGPLGEHDELARSTCGSSRSCAGWRIGSPKTTRVPSSSERWRTCWTGWSASSPGRPGMTLTYSPITRSRARPGPGCPPPPPGPRAASRAAGSPSRHRCTAARAASSAMPQRCARAASSATHSAPCRAGGAPPRPRQRVEDVRVHPDVGVREPGGAPPGVEQRSRPRRRRRRARACTRPEPAGRQPLPARVADLAAQREGVLEAGRAPSTSPRLQVGLRAQRLRPGQERRPARRRRAGDRLVQHRCRGLGLAAQQVHPADHRQRRRRGAARPAPRRTPRAGRSAPRRTGRRR